MDRDPVKSLLLALAALLPSPTGTSAQTAAAWCTQHHPCDWAAHTGAVLAGSAAVDLVTPLDIHQSRWVIAAYYLQREVRTLIRLGPGHPDTNLAFGLPLWLDSLIDSAAVAVGLWLAPKVWGQRLTLSIRAIT